MNSADNRKQIIGIFLVKNEEGFLDQVIRNTYDFCDKLIIVDNQSEDDTFVIAQKWSAFSKKVKVYTVEHPKDAHSFVRPFCGTNTWVFAIDGDELYDPQGLARLRKEIFSCRYDEWWVVFGNALNCIFLNEINLTAKGYLAPPCRSMTKLYNFSAITDWVNCYPERMHGGDITFKNGWNSEKRLNMHEMVGWDESIYRCLHLCFLQRSKVDNCTNNEIVSRQNIVESHNRKLIQRICFQICSFLKRPPVSQWKNEKYMRGDLVEKDVSVFFV